MSLDLAVPLIFVAFGCGLTTWSVLEIISAVLSTRWPRTTGTVVVSDLRRSRHSEGGVTYRPEVTYHYTVDGREFVASRTRFGDRLELSWSAPAVRTVRRYPAGASVTVRYHPEDPGEAVLEPGVNGLLLTGAGTALFFLAVGIFLMRAALEAS